MENSMPTAVIQPALPQFQQGIHAFSLKNAGSEYTDLLSQHGFTLKSDRIKVAYLADNFPTDTFSNEYGESFLDKFAQVASTGLGELNQMLGARTATQGLTNLGEALGDNMAGNLVKTGVEKMESMQTQAKAMAAKGGVGSNIAGSMLATANAVLAGARVDFPQVWKNSGFSPSYTMTIRLYNPNPGNPDSTQKYIVGPLAALLLLGTPISALKGDGSTYSWPFVCKIRSPGIYHLNAAFINSINVIKGGDQQSIAWNQSLAMCDVRIDFGSLFNSLLVERKKGQIGIEKRPTLATYLEAVGGQQATKRQNSLKAGGRQTNSVYDTPPLGRTYDNRGNHYGQYKQDEEDFDNRKKGGPNQQVKAQGEIDGSYDNRSSQADKEAADRLRPPTIGGR
jgi:hypothetical protein